MASRLWHRAEHDLCIQVPGGPPDLVVWEHAARTARMAMAISQLPEIPQASLDREALTAAALYHDIGWIVQWKAGQVGQDEILLRPTSDISRDLAADWVEAQLGGLLPADSLRKAAAAIRQSNNRRADLIEARILADADNLDQIGPPAVGLMVRKCRSEGKTLEHLLVAWQRQEEYRFWQARIKECFRFPSVRALAERRHQALRHFMTQLAASIGLDDLAELDGANRPAETDGHPTRDGVPEN
jgi:hypothetical protein